ncbi:hypothetical protein [Streptomyces filamentosus]|uniref:hypothetical protein n=1 Tax=Streptomyces filamentosus TaxID=67294 RepID=UPI0037D7DBB5
MLDLQWDSRGKVQGLIDSIQYHLEAPRSPTSDSPPHYALNWLRNSTAVGMRLASLHKGGPVTPPGTRFEPMEAHSIQLGDYCRARPGLFLQVTNMTTPRMGFKILRLSDGRTALVNGMVEVWRPIERVLQLDTSGPPAYAPAR